MATAADIEALTDAQLSILAYTAEFKYVPNKNRAFIRKLTKLTITDSDFEHVKALGLIKESKRGVISLACL